MSGDLAVQAVHGGMGAQQPRTDCRTPMVNSYQASDGRWFFLTEIDARRGFMRLCAAIDRPGLAADPNFKTARLIRQNRAALIPLLDHLFSSEPLPHWQDRFALAGVLWQKIASPEEVLADPQLYENGMLGPIVDGETVVQMVASPFTIDRQRRPVMGAPGLGERLSSSAAPE